MKAVARLASLARLASQSTTASSIVAAQPQVRLGARCRCGSFGSHRLQLVASWPLAAVQPFNHLDIAVFTEVSFQRAL